MLGRVVASVAITMVVLSPTSARAQCDSAPRLLLSDLTCDVGEPCRITVDLETGGLDVGSALTTLAATPPGSLTCPTSCLSGSGATTAACVINDQNCRFSLVDTVFPIEPFSNGEVALIDVTCTTVGVFSLSLEGLSLGNLEGGLVDGACGVGAELTCVDPLACGNGVTDVGEECDGADLAGQSCQLQGFDDGTLACNAACGFDTSACTNITCGDGTIEGAEVCDGANLAGQTCQTQGFDGGTLACDASCNSFDTSACTNNTCGDGTIEGVEQCDGENLNGQTCQSQLFDGGTLACDASCAFDVSACTIASCGDGNIDPGELCDSANLNAQTCVTLGFSSGTLSCSAACVFNTAGCNPVVCGDGSVDGDEQCDDGNTDAGDCCSPTCEIEAQGVVCRAVAGACDTEETCTGTSATCPADAVLAVGTICRAGGDECDPPETCTGLDPTCGPDTALRDETVCSLGVCCSGVCAEGNTCEGWVDLGLPQTISCRTAGSCTVPISIATAGREVGSLTAEISLDPLFECESPCEPGAAASGTVCDILAETCRWQLADITEPFTSVADGEAARITISCTQGGQTSFCVTPLEAFAPDGFAEQTVGGQTCTLLTCLDCLPGDCNTNDRNDSGDSVCVARCLTASAPAAADCTCGADCNCLDGLEASDMACAVIRNLAGDLGALDPCSAGTVEALRSFEGSGSTAAWLRPGSTRIVRSGRRRRMGVALRGSAATIVATLRTHIALDEGSLRRVRLSRRLRGAGFELIVNRIDDRHAVVVIAPPTTLPLPGMQKGRTFHLITRLDSKGLAVVNSEFGSTGGLPVPGL